MGSVSEPNPALNQRRNPLCCCGAALSSGVRMSSKSLLSLVRPFCHVTWRAGSRIGAGNPGCCTAGFRRQLLCSRSGVSSAVTCTCWLVAGRLSSHCFNASAGMIVRRPTFTARSSPAFQGLVDFRNAHSDNAQSRLSDQYPNACGVIRPCPAPLRVVGKPRTGFLIAIHSAGKAVSAARRNKPAERKCPDVRRKEGASRTNRR